MAEDKKVTIADAEKRYVPCAVYSRVVGYLTPVSNWHPAKQQEFADRTVYRVPSADDEVKA